MISDWSVPGRFAFFVFRVDIRYDCDEWFPGLEVHRDESAYYVGGTLVQWDSACYALLNDRQPHDCCRIYRAVYLALVGMGYTLRGKRSSSYETFYLHD